MLMSHLKVIAVSYNPDRDTRVKCVWPDHNQDVHTWDEHEDMFKKIIEIEQTYDAGVPVDTLIVQNGDCKGFFDYLDNAPSKNGKFIVRSRPNIGGSFGAYSYGYENFPYDTYLFTEDDLLVLGDNYYKKTLEKMKDTGADFVALLGIHNTGRFPEHAHGGIGLAKREALDVIAEDGELPYYKGEWLKPAVITFGEIPFTNNFLKAGKKMIYYGTEGWSLDNLIIPYFNITDYVR